MLPPSGAARPQTETGPQALVMEHVRLGLGPVRGASEQKEGLPPPGRGTRVEKLMRERGVETAVPRGRDEGRECQRWGCRGLRRPCEEEDAAPPRAGAWRAE